MSLFNDDATVAKVVQYFQDNTVNATSRSYWTGIDMSVHNDQPFFKVWVAFCSISKMINDYYYYSSENPSYPRRTPIRFGLKAANLVDLTVGFQVEPNNPNEVSGSNENGYLMSNMGSQYYSSSNRNYYLDTPYFNSSNPRANQALQLIWDSARVLNTLAKAGAANKELPNNGGLGVRILEGSEKLNVTIRCDVPLLTPLMPLWADVNN